MENKYFNEDGSVKMPHVDFPSYIKTDIEDYVLGYPIDWEDDILEKLSELADDITWNAYDALIVYMKWEEQAENYRDAYNAEYVRQMNLAEASFEG